jgi:O-antigen ligase
VPSENNAPSQKSFEFQWVVVLGLLFISIITGIFSGSLNENIKILFLIIIFGLSVILLVFLPTSITKYVLAVFLFVFIAAYDFVGYAPIFTVPIKIYFADGILLFMVVLVIHLFFHRVSILDLNSPITLLILLNFAFGIIAVIIGYYVGNTTNNILGDFRRFFLYPLVTFLPLSIKIKRSEWKKIFFIFCLSLLSICVIGFIRVITNTSWDPDQFSATNQFRAIGYFSGILLCIGVGLVYSVSINYRGWKKISLLLILVLFEAAIFASGYRLLWILGVFLPLFITFFSSRGFGKAFRLLGISVAIVLFLAALSYIVESLSPDVYYRLINRIYTTINDLDFRNNVRYFAWTSAWAQFMSSPIIGIGIGNQFEFISLNSNGQYVISHLTTHNILMSLLYQTGIIGAGFFLAIHTFFTAEICKGMSKLNRHNRILILGMLAGYFSALIMGMVQPSFESPGAIVIFYFFVGVILNIYRVFASDVNE